MKKHGGITFSTPATSDLTRSNIRVRFFNMYWARFISNFASKTRLFVIESLYTFTVLKLYVKKCAKNIIQSLYAWLLCSPIIILKSYIFQVKSAHRLRFYLWCKLDSLIVLTNHIKLPLYWVRTRPISCRVSFILVSENILYYTVYAQWGV